MGHANEPLYQDLVGPETVARLDGKIQLESKEDMKERGLPSPNEGDGGEEATSPGGDRGEGGSGL